VRQQDIHRTIRVLIFVKIVLAILLLVFTKSVFPPEADYKKIFGKDYTWAVNWLNNNDAVIDKYAVAYGLPAKELKAIVFPELIRYNGVFDALEVESLKYLYVSEGKHYANFSVGYFQMKPSFAEMVEEDARKMHVDAWMKNADWKYILTDTETGRRERVSRLCTTSDQVLYLCLFYKICELRFSNVKFDTPTDRLKFFATCYNAGYHLSYQTLLSLQSKNNFLSYNYSSISAYYYLNE
jgi:hypothetical protein